MNGNSQRTRLRRMKQDGGMRVVDQNFHSIRDVVQSGRTLALGARGRWFKSSHLDNLKYYFKSCYNLLQFNFIIYLTYIGFFPYISI